MEKTDGYFQFSLYPQFRATVAGLVAGNVQNMSNQDKYNFNYLKEELHMSLLEDTMRMQYSKKNTDATKIGAQDKTDIQYIINRQRIDEYIMLNNELVYFIMVLLHRYSCKGEDIDGKNHKQTHYPFKKSLKNIKSAVKSIQELFTEILAIKYDAKITSDLMHYDSELEELEKKEAIDIKVDKGKKSKKILKK